MKMSNFSRTFFGEEEKIFSRTLSFEDWIQMKHSTFETKPSLEVSEYARK